MTEPTYQGIKYPDRAESLRDNDYAEYRVFLEHWDELGQKLRFLYEGLALRGETRALLIHGGQGSGKTMFASRLATDFQAREKETAGFDPQNLWDRMTGGNQNSSLHTTNATLCTSILSIEDDTKWVETAKEWKRSRDSRHCIVIVDNAERGYFTQALLGLGDAEFLQLGRTDQASALAAERFVALARTELRRTLFLVLTNNDDFALSFEAGVTAQHQTLLRLESLPFPSHKDKETVIRTNINRLNPISYWYCLDKAGADAKRRVYDAIKGAETYPGAFAAVDEAIRTATLSRVGRPANKCVLTLVVFHSGRRAPDDIHTWAANQDDRCFDAAWLRITMFRDDWAASCLGESISARMLESEWSLRIVSLGDPYLGPLLSQAPVAAELLTIASVVHGTGTQARTITAYRDRLLALATRCEASDPTIDLKAFWDRGQERAVSYEGALRALYSTYDRTTRGFMNYRPDLVLEDYEPCSIVNAISPDAAALTATIRRKTHVLEFTAQARPSVATVQAYLKEKLQNYVRVMQEQ